MAYRNNPYLGNPYLSRMPMPQYGQMKMDQKADIGQLNKQTSVARSAGISFDHFNEYDWNYVMNMVYSDYYKSGNGNTNFYVELAKAFLMDKDAPEGKALKYYLAMKR